MDGTAAIALVSGIGAVAVWAVLLARELLMRLRRDPAERRRDSLAMPLAAFIASLGAFVAGAGYAKNHGIDTLVIDPAVGSLVAAMGRGALLAAGLILLTHRPERRAP